MKRYNVIAQLRRRQQQRQPLRRRLKPRREVERTRLDARRTIGATEPPRVGLRSQPKQAQGQPGSKRLLDTRDHTGQQQSLLVVVSPAAIVQSDIGRHHCYHADFKRSTVVLLFEPIYRLDC